MVSLRARGSSLCEYAETAKRQEKRVDGSGTPRMVDDLLGKLCLFIFLQETVRSTTRLQPSDTLALWRIVVVRTLINLTVSVYHV